MLRYKFLYEYGYDKGAVVAAAIVDDICATVRAYYRRAGDLEPGQLIYNAAAKDERGGRGKTMAKTRLVPVRLTLIADEDLDAIRQHLPFTTRREIRIRRLAHEAARQGAALTEADLALLCFARQQASTERRALPAGDYGVAIDGDVVAVVERKSLADLAARIVDGNLTYALAELATVDRAALVVEDRYTAIFKLDHVTPGFVADLLAAVQVRYPTVPIVFCDTRALAEEWTYRFLGAALAFAQAQRDATGEGEPR